MKIVVVGGVAGGMSFAARARRLSEDAHIVVLERDPYVSYANCGLPYHLAGEIPERDALLLHTPRTLAASLNLDVRTGHEVLAVDTAARAVTVRERGTGREYVEAYDTLVLSTGASPIVPPIPGVDLPQVRVLRTVPDVDALCALVDGGARRAVVAGAGFIGLEVAEALLHRGLAVTVVDLADQVLPPLDPEMARSVEQALVRAGVEVRTSTSVTAVRADATSGVCVRLSDGTELPADLVLLSVGVRPESSLARAAGLELNERGAVRVDGHLRTSAPGVYAVGDAIEVVDAVTGAPAVVPLAGPANRQGRAAANHLFGRAGGRAPVLGTAIVRVFDTVAATTGRSSKALTAAGIAHHAVHLHPGHHAGYYPGARSTSS
jgi:NADPH-dependent 2,4-dienoyl-CoA reductase/sulfur reductase-like enzyme